MGRGSDGVVPYLPGTTTPLRRSAGQRINVNLSTAPHASQRLIDVVSRPGFLLQCQTLPHFSHFRSVVLTLHH
jgi:hypothetical protein